MNEVRIRGIDDTLLTKIDRLAKSKNQSRQEYLSMILRCLTDAPFLVEQATNYMEVERLLLDTIEINNQLIEALIERLEW